MKGIETLRREQFHLGVMAQEIFAYDNVKGVSVEDFAVLIHLLIAQTDGHIHPSKRENGWSDHPQPWWPRLRLSGSWLALAVCGPRLKA